MNRVFISYRREDSQPYAGRLSDLLKTHLSDSVVFMDVDGIAAGEKFVQKIGEQLSACSVFLPVIGSRWLGVRQGFRRRLFLPNDFVRLEILAALKRPIEVIPVLVGGAMMPPGRSLPKSITALVELNAMPLSDNRFPEDVAALASLIKTRVGDPAEVGEAALQSERERVTHIIETDIRKARTLHRVQLATLLGSALLVLMVAIAWVSTKTKNQSLDAQFARLRNVYFDYDSADIRADARQALGNDVEIIKEILKHSADVDIVISGHHDPHESNVSRTIEIGQRRAQAVKDYLIDAGLPAGKLRVVNLSSAATSCTEQSEVCWQTQRVVAFAAVASDQR